MSSTSRRVLIIDDDLSFRKLLVMRLKSFIPGLTVDTFDNLESARSALSAMGDSGIEEFDLAILDEHLPDGRGADFLKEGWLHDLAVLSVSSDEAPEIPGTLMHAGATYFLSKVSVSEPLFRSLVLGLIERNELRRELEKARLNSAIVDTIKTLVSTLKHEINNPLGAVLGAAYLLRNQRDASADQKEAAELVESSGKRIKHVLDKLCETVALEPVTKGRQRVFHIPGDKRWDEES